MTRAKYMTQTQYAELRGVTKQYINKLVGQGKILLVARKIDVRQADAAMKAYMRPGATNAKTHRSSSKAKPKAKAGKTKAAPRRTRTAREIPTHVVPDDAPLPQLPGAARGDATSSLTANRATKEFYEAQTARLDYELRVGQTVKREDVLAAERRKNENIKNLFRQLPRSIAPLLDRLPGVAAKEDRLRMEIDALFERLARDPLGMAEQEAPAAAVEIPEQPVAPNPVPPVEALPIELDEGLVMEPEKTK
jgi:hypothetical protein